MRNQLRRQDVEWKHNFPRWLGDDYHIKALRKKYKEKGIFLTFKEARKRYQAGEYA